MAKENNIIRQPWFSVGEVVRLSLLGYDNFYRITKIVDLPNGRSSVKTYGYRLVNTVDNKPLTYGDNELNVFNESLLWKVPAESFLTLKELIHICNTTDYREKGETDND